MLSALGAQQALEVVKGQPHVDLILSEAFLPDMRGRDLIGEITRISPETAFILMSPVETEKPPGTPLLIKPFSLKELAAKVQEVLSLSALARRDLQRASQERLALQQRADRLLAELAAASGEAEERVRKVREDMKKQRTEKRHSD